MNNIAPNIDLYLWRPILADPPIYGIIDLDRISLDDVADAHEALDLREALLEKQQKANDK